VKYLEKTFSYDTTDISDMSFPEPSCGPVDFSNSDVTTSSVTTISSNFDTTSYTSYSTTSTPTSTSRSIQPSHSLPEQGISEPPTLLRQGTFPTIGDGRYGHSRVPGYSRLPSRHPELERRAKIFDKRIPYAYDSQSSEDVSDEGGAVMYSYVENNTESPIDDVGFFDRKNENSSGQESESCNGTTLSTTTSSSDTPLRPHFFDFGDDFPSFLRFTHVSSPKESPRSESSDAASCDDNRASWGDEEDSLELPVSDHLLTKEEDKSPDVTANYCDAVILDIQTQNTFIHYFQDTKMIDSSPTSTSTSSVLTTSTSSNRTNATTSQTQYQMSHIFFKNDPLKDENYSSNDFYQSEDEETFKNVGLFIPDDKVYE